MTATLLAHKDKELEQPLIDHLLASAHHAAKLAVPLKLTHSATLIALLHDVGKANPAFQDMLIHNRRAHVNHSSAGAYYVVAAIDALTQEDGPLSHLKPKALVTIKEWLAYPISAHHGLYDFISMMDSTYVARYRERLKQGQEDPSYLSNVMPFIEHTLSPACEKEFHLTLTELIIQAVEELVVLRNRLNSLSIAEQDNLSEAARLRQDRFYPAPKERFCTVFAFYESCTLRLLLSFIKEADVHDSANCFRKKPDQPYDDDELQTAFSELADKMEGLYDKFRKAPNPGALNQSRTHLADLAHDHAKQHENGIYKLTLPTGSGKTLAATRYATTNVHHFHKRRYLYVTSFLSVLEQSADVLRDVLGDMHLLEHHSNVILEEDDSDETIADRALYRPKAYLRESWEAPTILTTMVQFFNSLFGGRSNQIRRFSKLINATIVIDEIQNLGVDFVYPLNLMQNYLAHIMGATIVHTTATLPVFDIHFLSYPLLYGSRQSVSALHQVDIVTAEEIDWSLYHRAELKLLSPSDAPADAFNTLSTDELLLAITESLTRIQSLLIVVNTKKAALLLYRRLCEEHPEARIYYLTTNLCAAHRLNLIEEMRTTLRQRRQAEHNGEEIADNTPLICIATPLIEAGVDLDFDEVYRSLSGIDSVLQALGRANREGLRALLSTVYLFRWIEDLPTHNALKSIQERALVAEEALRNCSNRAAVLDTDELQDFYFKKYFLEKRNDMDCKIGKDDKNNRSALQELSLNSDKRESWKKEKLSPYADIANHAQAMASVSKDLRLIDNDGITLIVPYQNETVIDELLAAIDDEDHALTKTLLRQLQRYTVQIYSNQRLSAMEKLIYHNEELGIRILHKDSYHQDVGLDLTDEEQAFLLF